jgi:hypothetical protein
MTNLSIEKLALELFRGRMVRDKKGRLRREYPSGLRERQARDALAKMIARYMRDEEDPGGRYGRPVDHIRVLLIGALTGIGGRQLVFQAQKGRPSTQSVDAWIADYIDSRVQDGCPAEAATAYAEKEFSLSRKAIFAARQRHQKRTDSVQNTLRKLEALKRPVSLN